MRLAFPVIATVLQPCAPLVLSVTEGEPPEEQTLVVSDGDGRPTCDHDFPSAAVAERALATCAPGDAAWADGRGHATLQDAVDAAADGTAVLVCPGVHTSAVRIANRDLELSSFSGDPADTVLAGPDRMVTVEDSELTVSDLTLERGVGSGEGGSLRQSGGSLRLDGVVATDGEAEAGGAVWFSGVVLSIVDSAFTRSVATDGGAVEVELATCAEVVDSRFVGNEASYSGGALRAAEAADLLVVDSTFERNTSGYEGGAIHHGGWEDGRLTIADSRFVDNVADYTGGAIHVGSWATMDLALTDSELASNRSGYEGGAVSANAQGTCHVRIEDSIWTDNSAGHVGGALQVGGWEDDTLEVVGGEFVGNSADHSAGAIASGGWGDQTTRIVDVAFTGNEAGSVAAVGLGGWGTMDAVIEGGSFDGNVATEMSGALGHANGRLQVVSVDFGVTAPNTPADAGSECGVQILGAGASFTCDRGVWSVP